MIHKIFLSCTIGEFHLLQTSMENGQYLMVNESRRCVCLKVKDDGNELVSLNVVGKYEAVVKREFDS